MALLRHGRIESFGKREGLSSGDVLALHVDREGAIWVGTTLGLLINQVRVVAPEVGGGFGCKLNVYNDEVLVSWAAMQLGLRSVA